MYFIDGSAKDKYHNHDGAHDIADADNNNDEAVADPHLTVEDSCMNANGAEAGGCREQQRRYGGWSKGKRYTLREWGDFVTFCLILDREPVG